MLSKIPKHLDRVEKISLESNIIGTKNCYPFKPLIKSTNK